MGKLLRLAWNDVRLTLRDRAAFFWLLLTPLAMMWMFGQIGFGAGAASKVALTVIDRDGGWLARAFEDELAAPNVALEVRRDGATAEAGVAAARWIEIPAGFTANALAGAQQRLSIATAERAGADHTRAAEIVTARAVVRTLARLIEMRTSHGTVDAAGYAALRGRPALVSLDVREAGHGVRVPSGVAQSVPGILTFTVLMMTTIYGAVFLTIEKREGMLKRQLTLPVDRRTLFAGKVAGRLAIAAMQIAVLIAAGRFVFGLNLGRSPVGLAALLGCYALAVAGIATFLGAVLRSPEQASAVGWLASMVMAATGGCWWPSEIMPAWLRTAAHVFPTAWAMDGFHALISFGRGAEAVVLPCAVLIGFGVVFSLWGARRLAA